MPPKDNTILYDQAMQSGGRIIYMKGRCFAEDVAALRNTSFAPLNFSVFPVKRYRHTDHPDRETYVWYLRQSRLLAWPITADLAVFAAQLPTLRRYSFTEPVLWIKWYGVQGNMEFDKSELRALAELDIALAMDYIYIPGGEPPF
jgi:hypothetical protein